LTLRGLPGYSATVLSRTTLVTLVLLWTGAAFAQPTAAQPGPAAGSTAGTAAEHYGQGRSCYARGDFEGAIEAFRAVLKSGPHPAALFSIARCYENLGRPGPALSAYKEALTIEQDPAQRRNIEQRITALRARPVKVFVSSRPSGAAVTVDGRARPEAGRTPLVAHLTPGEHVLIVRLDRHHLATRRVVPEVGKELTVELPLEPLPIQATPRPCPKAAPGPAPLIDPDRLKLHLSALGATYITSGRPFAAGTGAQLHASFRRWLFGAYVEYLSMAVKAITPTPGAKQAWDRNSPGSLLALAEGGYMISLTTAYLYAAAGVGLYYERQKFSGWEDRDPAPDERIEQTKADLGFAWSVGGGVGAKITSWLSVGACVRFGVVHGERTNNDDPDDLESSNAAPYTTFSILLTVHP